jgi:hypothetical protein
MATEILEENSQVPVEKLKECARRILGKHYPKPLKPPSVEVVVDDECRDFERALEKAARGFAKNST